MLAYEKYTGVDWTLLTADPKTVATFWKFFGAQYDTVPDGPADIDAVDWETGKRYTYDVDHSNLVYIIDASGHPRLITEGLPSVGKVLPPKLESLLSPLGKRHLAHPGFDAWTETGLRDAVSSILGQNIPPA
jgi:cytochrome oxidase Cu insertion factor (SCO1/SenC/PrrC family)